MNLQGPPTYHTEDEGPKDYTTATLPARAEKSEGKVANDYQEFMEYQWMAVGTEVKVEDHLSAMESKVQELKSRTRREKGVQEQDGWRVVKNHQGQEKTITRSM